jgi:hypothetical protein
MFPIKKVLGPIVDSRGVHYRENIDFIINECGNISWIDGMPNPGIDPSTGSGRVFSCRYLYRAFYYVTEMLREVRITDITRNGIRSSERMPMFVKVTREYLFHNINRGNELNQPPKKEMEPRQTIGIPDNIEIKDGIVKVETTDIDNDT